MKNLKKYIGLCGVALLPALTQAQTISFETEDYGSLGVYDTWEASPFRTGALAGNVKVLDNHLTADEANTTEKILGFQRSRLGSNTFGVRINLKETFELTPTVRYVHVLMHKPTDGRVMLIGLGKRNDRADQSAEVEQFWAFPVNDVKSGEWFDAVFPIKGNGGIDIYSLVIVPDLEAPHDLTGDFAAYFDEIVINDDLRPRTGVEDYAVNFSSDSQWGRTDRIWNGLSLEGSSDGNQSITIDRSELKGYMHLFGTVLKAKPGDVVTPKFNYSGSWMHGYVYLDRGRDGQYSYGVTSSDLLDTTTDLMSYSCYRSGQSGAFHNSAGTALYESNSGHNVLNPPSFTVPADLTPGLYRMRYKIDWNSIDPGGEVVNTSNNILSNGGGVADVILNIHGDEVNVRQDNRNGEVLVASTGEAINNNRIPFGEDFTIKMNPSNGFEYNGIRVRHGYNLDGDSIVKSTPQYRDEFFYCDQFGSDDTFTIPGSIIDGDVLIEGLFVEEGKGIKRSNITYNIMFGGKVVASQVFNLFPGSEFPEPSIELETSPAYYTFANLPEGEVPQEDTTYEIILVQTPPFEASAAINDDTVWHTLTITSDKNRLAHDSSLSYIDLSADGTGENTQWAFIGDVVNGFKIVNRAAGEGYILSSPTNVTSSNDGRIYPIMTAEPVPATNNTYWIPTKSTDLSGQDGFYLHQLGHLNNRMNSRDNRLAYWVGGADGGSTFLATAIDDRFPDIDYCTPEPASGRSVSNGLTNRTDRYLTELELTDGTTSLTIPGGGSASGRSVVQDRTSSIFTTTAGKTVTMQTTGAGYWVNTFLYIDFDLNGFTVADKVVDNYEPGVSNMPDGATFTFVVPAETRSGYYRARFFHDWLNEDPCIFGESGNDNGELAMDFWIRVKGNTVSIDGIEGDEADGPTEYYNMQGVRIPAENLVPGFYIVKSGSTTSKVYIK